MPVNPWPADQVERRAVAALVPYARNARTHSDEQVAQIAASIREWGWTVPVLVDETGMIIAGHGRVLAAARLGIGEVPVTVARGWSEAQKRAYVIADNKLTDNGGWDQALLTVEVADLASMGFDLPLIGFSEADLVRLTGSNSGLTDPDEAPEPPAVPVVQRGEVWQLGRHRLVCGDATSAEDVAKALGGVAPHLMVTDPPYGVAYDPAWRDEAQIVCWPKAKRATGKVAADDQADWSAAWALFPGDVAYVWHSGLRCVATLQSLEATGFAARSQIIWRKQLHAISRGDYHWQHEPCWYVVKNGRSGHWSGDRSQMTVWDINTQIGFFKPEGHSHHGTQKPVECMKRPIENNSSPGQAVYDPFLGSGTTIIAAEMTAIEPAYCDVTIERWQNFTGEKAQRIHEARTQTDADPSAAAAG
jgi:DNA modification methylase